MPRPTRSRLSPWIESLILGYGSREESGRGRLKAHVIGVGQMTLSQALGSEGPTGLLFLSDGLLQIPAILTASAWEHLQEQEDRECFTSLLNTTVCIQDYRLQFHMALEQTKCRFVLSVGELATTAAGPVKDGTPCSTTLPSVRSKICKTWRALLGQETQDSQCGFDLSELLGEWQHDCLQAVLEDVRDRLTTASPQPTTSTCDPSATHPDTFTTTSWDVDRIRYKGEKRFSVPMKCLLIPEEDSQQMQTPPNVRSGTASGLSVASEDRNRDSPRPSGTTPPSVDDAEWRTAKPAVVEGDEDASETSPCVEDSMLDENAFAALIDGDVLPLSNPWDNFSPPWVTFSSDVSPPSSPPPHNPAAPEFRSDHSVISTSTQLPVHSSEDSQQTSESTNLPLYQKQPHSSSPPVTAASLTSVSPPDPLSRPSGPLPASEERHDDAAKRTILALDQESQILEEDVEETIKGKYRKAKRKRSEPTPEAKTTLVEEEEAQIGGSPPSWLFDTPAGSGADEGSGHGETLGAVSRKRPTVHSDGRLFSYSYQLSGQNLLDFSRLKVAESLLHWAVKYLVVPKQTDDPVTSNRTSSNGANGADAVDVTTL
ncbi:adrenocortical dysplasia protein homolog [Anoplopoma fimbria]|uniref:adrenocortical dysplasia protein homolog n=1 Tax=Anoplopoma fimbria TaxID=229290 RepID=UPI0023EDEBB6|nr:adrenocortical dysplasia protein homolog [Anoplopoma fimbria]